MFSGLTVIAFFCLYMGILFLIAMWVEKKYIKGVCLANNPIVYSLTLAVYCTSWTFYGSIGLAATSGNLFLTIYIGPVIIFIFGYSILKRLIKIKIKHRITSIADFISVRYDRSQVVAATAAIIALAGIAPYIALQLKAVISTFKIVAITKKASSSWIESNVGPVVVVLMIVFTNLFGVRRLDPTERHPGMVTAVALESLVKLLAFIMGGVFVTYFIYDGFTDIFQQVSDVDLLENIKSSRTKNNICISWITYIILSMSAIIFLPRQFHVTVVENFNESHIKTAMWLFPLYMVLINIFVLPVAFSGLLMGFPKHLADTFLLYLPFYYGQKWLSLGVFIGGFSAATSMIMISSMTLSTMITNHLLLPLIEWVSWLKLLRRHLIQCRWAAVICIITIGYIFEITLGESYMLVSMGMISFAAVLQFAPAVLGGIFWEKGNKAGALAGMWAGFFIWFYTSLLPAFVKSGWVSDTLLTQGPDGIKFLRPENLFGLTSLAPMPHSVFWSLFFNISLYILFSLYFQQTEDEQRLAKSFVNILDIDEKEQVIYGESKIDCFTKKRIMEKILRGYFPKNEAKIHIKTAEQKAKISNKNQISIKQLADLYGEVELILSGAIGAAAAHQAMKKGNIFTPDEAKELSIIYGQILASLKITPEELIKKIHYYKEREILLSRHAEELEEKIQERENHILQRQLAEEELRKSEEKYRNLFEFAPDGIMISNYEGQILSCNAACIKIFKYKNFDEMSKIHVRNLYYNPDQDRKNLLEKLHIQGQIKSVRLDAKDVKGKKFPASLSLRMIKYEDQSCIQTIIRDITNIKKMEDKLQRYTENLEKMVDEKTRELQNTNNDLSKAVKSLEETQKQLTQSAHQAGMAEIAVSVLHNIGNAVNSINVRACSLESASLLNEIQSLKKIKNLLESQNIIIDTNDVEKTKKEKVLAFFDAIIEVIEEKNNLFKDDLKFIQKSLDHIIEIVSVQQKYAGLKGFETYVNINDLIKDAEEMLFDSIVKRGIETKFTLEDVPILHLDKNKMIQIFINIIKNAYEAINSASDDNERKIYIKTSAIKQDKQEYVNIEIADTGSGVSPEIKDKIFRFNFSTKGRDTGFGLHDSANYIKAQGGSIELRSKGSGKGAQVIIQLPISGGISE